MEPRPLRYIEIRSEEGDEGGSQNNINVDVHVSLTDSFRQDSSLLPEKINALLTSQVSLTRPGPWQIDLLAASVAWLTLFRDGGVSCAMLVKRSARSKRLRGSFFFYRRGSGRCAVHAALGWVELTLSCVEPGRVRETRSRCEHWFVHERRDRSFGSNLCRGEVDTGTDRFVRHGLP